MIKIQFCSGGNNLPGWINHDMDCDIRNVLPYPAEHADFIFCEHGLEHVTHQQAWMFLADCYRILKVGGVLRVAIPDVSRIWDLFTEEYGAAVKAGGHGDATQSGAVMSAVFNHGHQAAWTQELLMVAMMSVGFTSRALVIGMSSHEALRGIEGHGKVVGANVARIETSIVEGTK